MKEFNEVTTGNFRDENFMLKWFLDGKLNVSGMLIFIEIFVDDLEINDSFIFFSS
jgi:hypothetical protein